MNGVFEDMQDLKGLVEMPVLEDLCLRKNGIININGIETKFPNLTVLDLSYNKIFSVANLEVLS
jgi:Leucine-rich repeat (LRR) protein